MKLKIGDKVKVDYWEKNEYVEILDIGKLSFWGKTEKCDKASFSNNCDWIPYIEPNDDLVKDAMPDYEATLNFEQETWERLKELEKHLNLQHKENLTVAEFLDNIQSSINNINKRLGDLEASRGKLAKTDVKDLQLQMRSLSKRICAIEECNGIDILNAGYDIIKKLDEQNKRITALEQLQPKQTHPDANDTQHIEKHCYNCKHQPNPECSEIVGRCYKCSKWEQS